MNYVCLLGIDPEKAQKCKPSECASCGWEAAEAARRRENARIAAHILTTAKNAIAARRKLTATPKKN